MHLSKWWLLFALIVAVATIVVLLRGEILFAALGAYIAILGVWQSRRRDKRRLSGRT
jgi:Flp pilus assembly protein TadB